MPERPCHNVAFRLGGLLLLLVVAPVAVGGADAPAADRFAWLDEFVPPLLTEFRVPGAAVVVVVGDEVAYLGGFGVCDEESKTPVTTGTAFGLASATKTFTATAAAALVDAGKVGWDTRVGEILKGFRVADPVGSERMTLRDLLTHRTGMSRHNVVLTNPELSRQDLVRDLRLLETAGEHRDGFRYSNLMVAVAGEMLARAAGSSWEEVVREHPLDPLGMAHTTVGVPSDPELEVAAPHFNLRGRLRRLDPLATEVMAPATGLFSTAEDMARWLRFQLAAGRLGERRVVAEAALLETHAPQVAIPTVGTPELPMAGYGMGWRVLVWKGRKMLMHGGGAVGYSSHLALLPFDGVGVAVLTNSALNPVGELVATRALEVAVGLEPTEQVERARQVWAGLRQMEINAHFAAQRSRGGSAPPSRPPADFVGTYTHPLYGAVEVTPGERGIAIRVQGFEVDNIHLHHEVFLILHPLFDDLQVEFRVDPDKGVTSLAIPLEPTVAPIEFERVD